MQTFLGVAVTLSKIDLRFLASSKMCNLARSLRLETIMLFDWCGCPATLRASRLLCFFLFNIFNHNRFCCFSLRLLCVALVVFASLTSGPQRMKRTNPLLDTVRKSKNPLTRSEESETATSTGSLGTTVRSRTQESLDSGAFPSLATTSKLTETLGSRSFGKNLSLWTESMNNWTDRIFGGTEGVCFQWCMVSLKITASVSEFLKENGNSWIFISSDFVVSQSMFLCCHCIDDLCSCNSLVFHFVLPAGAFLTEYIFVSSDEDGLDARGTMEYTEELGEPPQYDEAVEGTTTVLSSSVCSRVQSSFAFQLLFCSVFMLFGPV